MNIVEALLHLFGRLRVRNGAAMLTIKVGFHIKLNERVCLQEELRREEFILVQKSRIEPQFAKYLALEGIAASPSAKVAMLKEQPPPSPPKEG